mmetsp:Transcript_7537/g.7426  ORF Transcript_7537/g.7426 Transcript_7537/m.7426 type:complete len:86 (+) Transcript_7537:44-301(+)
MILITREGKRCISNTFLSWVMTCSMIMHNREEEEETDVGDAKACHGNRDNHSFNGHTSYLFIATSHRHLAFLPPRISDRTYIRIV